MDRFGLVSIAQAIAIFAGVVVDYGYNLTSTREISLNRNDMSRVQEIAGITLCGKLILFLISLGLLLVASFLFPQVWEERVLYLAGFSLVVGQFLFPVWLFQGLERMQYITLFNAVAKVVSLVLIFILIRGTDDYELVIPCLAAGLIIMSILSYYVLYMRYGIKLKMPELHQVMLSLRQGFPVFTSNVSVALYSTTTILMLGFFSSNTVVGYYSTAEKIMMVPRQVAGIFSQAIYPQLCQIAGQGWQSIKAFWSSWMPILLAVVVIVVTCIFLFAEKITLLLAGESISQVSELIQILMLVPLAVSFNVYSYLTLLAFDFRSQVVKVMLPLALVNLVLNAILSYTFGAVGTAWSLVITEVLIALFLYFILQRSISKFTSI